MGIVKDGKKYKAIVKDHEYAIELGGKQDKKVPNLNASRWNDEIFLNINARSVTPDSKKEKFKDDKFSVSSDGREDIFWVNENGNLQYSIFLLEKPASNIFELDIDGSSGLRFIHQPELTPEEIAEGDSRPENIVNSYAIYTNKHGNKYRAGKFAHIERSWVRGTDGIKVWCSQTIVKKSATKWTWTITVPQEIIDNESIYPLEKDGTIGYTSIGGSSRIGVPDTIAAFHNLNSDMSSDGIASSVSIYCLGTAGGDADFFKFGIYDGVSETGPETPVDFSLETSAL